MAIDELNAAGGVLGRSIEPVVRDGASDPTTFAREAERLITVDQVAATFGCWTSCRPQAGEAGDRAASAPAVLSRAVRGSGGVAVHRLHGRGAEPADHPGRDLGARQPRADASSSSDPTMCFRTPPTRSFATSRPRSAARSWARSYVPLGARDMTDIVNEIGRARPDVILNSINGDSNAAFFRALRQAGISPARIPTVSFSIAETELADHGRERLRRRLRGLELLSVGRHRGEPAVRRGSAPPRRPPPRRHPTRWRPRISVCICGRARCRRPARPRRRRVIQMLADQSFAAPGRRGLRRPVTHHTWKTVRIGRIRSDGQFDIVWDSRRPVRPTPFPAYRSRAEWEAFLDHPVQSMGRPLGQRRAGANAEPAVIRTSRLSVQLIAWFARHRAGAAGHRHGVDLSGG